MTHVTIFKQVDFDLLKNSETKYMFVNDIGFEHEVGDKIVAQCERQEFELFVDRIERNIKPLRTGWSLLLLSEPTLSY